jgi:hypothetical protein
MTAGNKRLTQRLIAIIVIVAILDVIGISPVVMIFFLVVGFLVWRAVQRSENQETGRVFDFYISADEILRDEERHWYGFEITEIISRGEQAFHSMPDPPPLIYFALGALCHRREDYHTAAEYLAYVVEDELSEERRRAVPSPELRRYVRMLRKIEREPSMAPQETAAVRSLERIRRHRAANLLAESRERLLAVSGSVQSKGSKRPAADSNSAVGLDLALRSDRPLSSIIAPPPIAEVLADVYQEDKAN